MDWIAIWLWAGLAVVVAISFLIISRKKQPAVEIEPPEPIQKYDRFPEPKRGPTKTVEVRDDKEVPF